MTAQDQALEELSRAYGAYLNLKRTIDAEMKAERTRRLNEARVKPAMLAAQARTDGISIQRIAQYGLGTRARETAYKLIEEGERYLIPAHSAPANAAPASDGFFWADATRENFVAYPSGKDLEAVLAHLDIASYMLDATPALANATFRLATTPDGNPYVEAVTPGFDAEHGRHPVVALMQMDAAYAQRALEWAQANAA